MKFAANIIDPTKQPLDCLVLSIFTDCEFNLSTANIDSLTAGAIKNALDTGDFLPELENTLLLRNVSGLAANRILLVGCGSIKKFNECSFIKIASAAFATLRKTRCQSVGIFLTELLLPRRDLAWMIKNCIFAANTIAYDFDHYKNKKNPPWTMETICFHAHSAQDLATCEQAIWEAEATANAIDTAKNLANEPCNICTPTYLAEQATALAKLYSELKCKILEEKTLVKMGFGAFCAVSQGSEEIGKLILLEYQGANKNQAPYALIGKGITFDSGGLSLKQSANMMEMKFDMCGAATVLAVIQAVCQLKLPINLVGALACAENMPDGKAIKPDSVVKTLSGLTVEINNTDAEGRLVLADTLTYVEKEYQPKTMIDVATLTGAVISALGRNYSGLFSNNDDLVTELTKATEQSHDLTWRLPLDDNFCELLVSQVADLANVSIAKGEGGASVAAAFLSQFIKVTPWAHLDIAGVAWLSGKEKKATGRGVALLVQYLLNQATYPD